MDTIKKWLMWILIIAAFWIFSNFLISVGLNSSYKDMSGTLDNTDNSNINVYQAQVTQVNGRILGSIANNGDEDISGKYLQVDLFNSDGQNIGEQFLQIPETEQGGVYPFDINFQVNGVKSYALKLVDSPDYSSDYPSFELFDNASKLTLLKLMIIAMCTGII